MVLVLVVMVVVVVLVVVAVVVAVMWGGRDPQRTGTTLKCVRVEARTTSERRRCKLPRASARQELRIASNALMRLSFCQTNADHRRHHQIN